LHSEHTLISYDSHCTKLTVQCNVDINREQTVTRYHSNPVDTNFKFNLFLIESVNSILYRAENKWYEKDGQQAKLFSWFFAKTSQQFLEALPRQLLNRRSRHTSRVQTKTVIITHIM